MSTVLVTGAAGYIGQVLCERLLDASYKVIAIDNLMYGQAGPLHLARHPDLTFCKGDVRDYTFMADWIPRADAIIHLAAIVGQDACERNHQLSSSVNAQGMKNLLALRSVKQFLIYPNTNSGYGSHPGVCTEDTPMHPLSLYAQQKAYAESLVLEHENVISLRLATVFGPSPRVRLGLLVHFLVYEALHEHRIVIYQPEFRRNFIHIDDVVEAMLFCLARGTRGVYNLGNDTLNMTKRELVLRIKAAIPTLDIVFSEVGEDPDQRNYEVSSARLQAEGFVALRSLEMGVSQFVSICKMLPEKGPWRNT